MYSIVYLCHGAKAGYTLEKMNFVTPLYLFFSLTTLANLAKKHKQDKKQDFNSEKFQSSRKNSNLQGFQARMYRLANQQIRKPSNVGVAGESHAVAERETWLQQSPLKATEGDS